jgi:exopolyphosphatase/guanosine-5'-triphosphate,3'-diphosphate pyrophosphatase
VGVTNVAAVDIGTNSVRLLITDPQGRELERHMQITRLGQGVDVTGSLHPDAIARTLAVLSEYGELIRKRAVARTRAAATSAARDADNSQLFFDAAEHALGARPELLPGEEEALLSFRGATFGLDPSQGPFLVVDIGGGSTEFVLGATHPVALISVKMGCVRMTERYLQSDPPAPGEIAACQREISRILETVRGAVPVQQARRMIGLAGTITTLASLQQGLMRYDPTRTHHARLTRDDVERLFARLASADVATRRGMLAEPKRAEVIVGGVLVLLMILREFAITELLVSESDILDGLAASLR